MKTAPDAKSMCMYLDHGNNVHIFPTDDIAHFNNTPLVIQIAAAIVSAGYKGVRLDEYQLKSGRWFHSPNVCTEFLEGRLMAELMELHLAGKPLPQPVEVLTYLSMHYATESGSKKGKAT